MTSVALLSGCGETTDVSGAVERLNNGFLAGQKVRLECPREVDGGDGANFECTLRNPRTGRAAPVTLRIVKDDGQSSVDMADGQQFGAALRRVRRR